MSAHEKGIEAAMSSTVGETFVRQGSTYHRAGVSNEDCENIIRAYLEASGQVLVPREPTDEMLRQAYECDMKYVDETSSPSEYWAALIAAYPQPFSQEKT